MFQMYNHPNVPMEIFQKYKKIHSDVSNFYMKIEIPFPNWKIPLFLVKTSEKISNFLENFHNLPI